jgi:hypothetical protein
MLRFVLLMLSLFNVAFVLLILSLFDVALCFDGFSHRLMLRFVR